MREYLKGKKSYLIATAAVALAVASVVTGELTLTEGAFFLLGGGALAAVRDAIG